MNDFPESKSEPSSRSAMFGAALADLSHRLWRDQSGFVFSIEMLLLGTVVVIGLIVGHTSVRDALNCELSDIGGALQDLNQSFSYTVENSDGSVLEASFVDTLDFCDQPGDPSGAADNCIVFNVEPADEVEPKVFEVSEVGSLNFDSVNTGFGGSATGLIGDGGLETTFTTTTDTGQILGSANNLIRFRESPNASGTFTTTFADPLTNVELFVTNLTNTNAGGNNVLGNFTVTLSDGTVLNNAAFTVLPDAIAPNSAFGEFSTFNADRESLSVVTIGGNQFVTDPTTNGPGNQAGGRIVFTGVPPVGTSPSTTGNPVGISSISFERSGGPNNFSAFFGFSGQVIICEHE